MELHNFTHDQERSTNRSYNRRTIEISLGAPETSGKQTAYKRQTVKVEDLPRLMKEHNYSPIVWTGNYRLSENFVRATGFCVDIDGTMTIQAALQNLQTRGWNFVISTTRSHTEEEHHFRILLPFSRPVCTLKDYQRIIREICAKHFPNNDPRVLDGARQLYHSPEDAVQHFHWSGTSYDVDSGLTKTGKSVQVQDAWNDQLAVRTNDGTTLAVSAIKKKTAIHCPFHDDHSPSAFLDHSKASDNWFIFCSSCGKTFWKEELPIPIETRCDPFYSFGTDVYKASVLGDRFTFSKVGQKKFYVWTRARNQQDEQSLFAYLCRDKHLDLLARIDYVGDMTADRTYYRFDPSEGVFTVFHAPLAEKLKDNEFIESWLRSLFGEHVEFIKQWLAAYCYTNYRKLPTLILKGVRGSGKSKFAESLMAIYPSISQMWRGEEKEFTPEVQCKLIVADESVSSNERQYRVLKQRSGQKFALVNQKFVPEYQVRNNMNIIVMSNDHTPVFVRKDELPTDEKNNQFFVYEFPPIKGDLDPDIAVKIEERLGHYIRTELKEVYEKVQKLTGFRYSIPTPITEAEKALFDVNVTGLEAESDKFLQKLVETKDPMTRGFIDKGRFPISFIDSYELGRGYSKAGIIRNLKERGYLEPRDAVRVMVGGERKYCFELTQKAKEWIAAQKAGEKKTS